MKYDPSRICGKCRWFVGQSWQSQSSMGNCYAFPPACPSSVKMDAETPFVSYKRAGCRFFETEKDGSCEE